MKLDRRSFLKMTTAAGVAVVAAPNLARRALAAEAGEGLLWVTVHASGGWDPTLLCDPKGRRSEADPDPVNTYAVDDIVDVGPFRCAPVAGVPEFFQRFRSELLVLNGVDTQTNSHETGTRHTWSGSMDPGQPALAAIMAASAPSPPTLAYLSHGGYALTDGIVAPTRMPDTSAVLEIAFPERLDPDDPASKPLLEPMLQRLRDARAARLQRQIEHATLPRVRRSMGLLRAARSGDNDLARLAGVLPEELEDTNNPLIRQAEVTLACFQAGVSVSASLSIGGFDTHGDHDDDHTPRIQQTLEGVTWLMDEAERRGLADRLVVVVGSDFGRTPWYNDTQGKDHWPITSMLLMGPGIRGGRVIGATDDRQVPLGLDAASLKVVESGGVEVTPAHVHASLRRLAGIDGTELDLRYGVGEPLPLLG